MTHSAPSARRVQPGTTLAIDGRARESTILDGEEFAFRPCVTPPRENATSANHEPIGGL
jgi:hypothetical protein